MTLSFLMKNLVCMLIVICRRCSFCAQWKTTFRAKKVRIFR